MVILTGCGACRSENENKHAAITGRDVENHVHDHGRAGGHSGQDRDPAHEHVHGDHEHAHDHHHVHDHSHHHVHDDGHDVATLPAAFGGAVAALGDHSENCPEVCAEVKIDRERVIFVYLRTAEGLYTDRATDPSTELDVIVQQANETRMFRSSIVHLSRANVNEPFLGVLPARFAGAQRLLVIASSVPIDGRRESFDVEVNVNGSDGDASVRVLDHTEFDSHAHVDEATNDQ